MARKTHKPKPQHHEGSPHKMHHKVDFATILRRRGRQASDYVRELGGPTPSVLKKHFKELRKTYDVDEDFERECIALCELAMPKAAQPEVSAAVPKKNIQRQQHKKRPSNNNSSNKTTKSTQDAS